MATPFSPTRRDVERYRELRLVSMDLNHRIMKTVPRRAMEDIGDGLGIRRDGILRFDSQDMANVLMDCCFYDWFENGKNLVQRYSETHPAKPGTDEAYLLNGYLQAKYRLMVVQSGVPGAGLHCRDVMNNVELFVMDLGLSESANVPDAVFASRTVPLGEYSMTTGAGLPVNSKEAVLDALSRIEIGKHKALNGPGSVALLSVRACLAAGAAEYTTYESIEPKSKRHHRRHGSR